MLAEHLEHATSTTMSDYVQEAILEPLSMSSSALEGSCAKDIFSTVSDLVLFVNELRSPTLISRDTWKMAISPVFAHLAGIVPGIGPSDPCLWGLGLEIKGQKSPHWTATRSSASTHGHFGGIGTFMWVDPVADISCVMFSEHEFDDWGMEYWPVFNDAVLTCLKR